MTRLLSLSLLFFSTLSFGQNTSNFKIRTQDFQDSLIKNSIDTLIVYTYECIGYYQIVTDSCKLFNGCFVFWKQNDKTFLQRIDDCKIYKSVLLDTANPLTFYISQKRRIDQELIYPPTYFPSNQSNLKTAISMYIDHACHNEITTIVKTKKILKDVNEYYLNFKKFDNGKKNIYYNYNQKTQLKKLVDNITQLLQQLDKTEKFKAQ